MVSRVMAAAEAAFVGDAGETLCAAATGLMVYMVRARLPSSGRDESMIGLTAYMVAVVMVGRLMK